MQEITLSSDVAREVIRCILITCRNQAAPDLSQAEVAKHLGVGQPMVNKFVNPKRVGGLQMPGGIKLPTWDQTVKLMHLFGTPDRLPILEQIHRVAKVGSPSGLHTIGLLDQAAVYMALEPYALAIEAFEQSQLHGMLQTRSYVEALIRRTAHLRPDFKAEQALAIRLARTTILTRSRDPLHFTCYLDESVLYRMIIRGRSFIDALEHVLQLMELPNVVVRIVPMDLADSGHPGSVGPPSGGPMALVRFTSEWVTCYSETRLSGYFYDSPPQTQHCARAMGQYDLLALSEEQSRDRIKRRIKELETQQA